MIVDHPNQLKSAHIFKELTGAPLQVFVKVDTGYHRAGLEYTTKSFGDLVEQISIFERTGLVVLVGFYSHGTFHETQYFTSRPFATSRISGMSMFVTYDSRNVVS